MLSEKYHGTSDDDEHYIDMAADFSYDWHYSSLKAHFNKVRKSVDCNFTPVISDGYTGTIGSVSEGKPCCQ